MTAKLSIRQMSSRDVNRVREIVALSFSKLMGFFALHSILSEEGKVLVAENDGKVVGFAKIIEFQIGGDKFGCILWIGVHPLLRRKWIGSSLTNEGIHRLKQDGAKTVFASTQRRNIGAQNVLIRNGFRRIGFLDLWHIFRGWVFEFYSDIWLAPGEIVLMHD